MATSTVVTSSFFLSSNLSFGLFSFSGARIENSFSYIFSKLSNGVFLGFFSFGFSSSSFTFGFSSFTFGFSSFSFCGFFFSFSFSFSFFGFFFSSFGFAIKLNTSFLIFLVFFGSNFVSGFFSFIFFFFLII